ncbi:MAG: RES domain-containing protein [Chryseobacterium sp.]|nr:MAG: RES domain-containing protein [Chryseobacterium sp.]
MGLAKQRYMELEAMNLNSIPDKQICARHFEDRSIINHIKRNQIDGYCDYCEKELKVIDLENLMEFIMAGIANFYTDAANFMSYDSREGGYLGKKIDRDDLIQEEIGLITHPFEVTEDIIDCIEDIVWGEPDLYYDNINDELEYQWTYFKNIIKHESRYLFSSSSNNQDKAYNILKEVGKLIHSLKLIKTLPKGTRLYRCRQHDSQKKLNDFEEITSPPNSRSIYPNRFSPSGISMFYAAFNSETAILETVSREDPLKTHVTIGEFETLEDFHIIDFTKLPKIPSIFGIKDKGNYYLKLFLYSFVNDITKNIDKDGREHIEYVPTQVVTEYIRYSFNKNLKNKIEGITYESSQHRNHNSAVFFWDNNLSKNKVKLITLDKKKLSV